MKYFGVLVAASAVTLSTPAGAALLTFTITGDYSALFTLDSSPIPDGFDLNDNFRIDNVPGFADSPTGFASLYFYTVDGGGGLAIDGPDGALLNTQGEMLFTGATSSPSFRLGTFALTEFSGPGRYSLTIAEARDAVPEPMTWAMLIGGFALAGAALRARRHYAQSALPSTLASRKFSIVR